MLELAGKTENLFDNIYCVGQKNIIHCNIIKFFTMKIILSITLHPVHQPLIYIISKKIHLIHTEKYDDK